MSDEKVWTREALTEQILKDVKGMWEHCEREAPFRLPASDLFAAVKGGCVALLEGELADTKDLLTLAVSMLHTIRELSLEAQQQKGTALS